MQSLMVTAKFHTVIPRLKLMGKKCIQPCLLNLFCHKMIVTQVLIVSQDTKIVTNQVHAISHGTQKLSWFEPTTLCCMCSWIWKIYTYVPQHAFLWCENSGITVGGVKIVYKNNIKYKKHLVVWLPKPSIIGEGALLQKEDLQPRTLSTKKGLSHRKGTSACNGCFHLKDARPRVKNNGKSCLIKWEMFHNHLMTHCYELLGL